MFVISDFEKDQGLRRAHKKQQTIQYDGHNRRTITTTIHDLRTRRYRRTWNQRMRETADDLSNEYYTKPLKKLSI